MMRAPKLNRKMTLEAPVRLSDGAGGYTRNWSVIGTHWVALDGRTGRERAGVGTPISRAAYRIIVRAAPVGSPRRPMPEQRFREGQRVFEILAVTEADENARYLICHAKEERVI